ncbi:MAG: hypothetical protein PHC50_05055 [Candidatus Cloacimonetes bacterium]|nr:hypothetical protein [Candidatus Cloacimonadota bacterium]
MPKLKLHSASVYDLQHERGNKLRDNMGLNFSLKPDQNSTARITIQPDFSDTALDSETSIYNSKYPPMIEENRGFFIEDYDLLAARSDFWYTRQIISPLAAIKYNRTENNSALAILALKDKKYDNEAESGDYWLASGYAKNIGVQQVIFNAYARTSEDLGDQNLLGYLILGIRPWHKIVINPEFCLSYDNLSDTKQIGTHGKLATAWQGEHLSFICGYEYIDKDFSARMGAVNETDQSRLMAQLRYQRYYQSILNSISAEIAVSDIYDQDFTQNQYRYLNLSMSAAGFENALSLNYNSSFSEELYSLSQYGIFSHSWDLSLSKYRYMVPSLNLAYGKSIIYSQNRTANYLSFTPRIWLEVNQNTNLGLGAYYIKYYMPQTDNFDNEYFLFNLNLQTRFVDKISITQGIRLNDYTNTIVPASEESPAMLNNGYIGYYVNLDWKLNNNIGIIAGYKSKENRLRMGNMRQLLVDDQNVYLKMEYQF